MATHAATRPLGALGRMSLVGAIHLAVLFAIMRSLGIGAMPVPEREPDRVRVTIDKARQPDDPPPRPDYVVQNEAPVIRFENQPPLEFEQEVIDEPPAMPGELETGPAGGDAIPRPVIQSVRQDPRHPLTKPEYSARMIREGNQGNIELEVYVLANGRVGDARVIRSTGFEELDRAALAEAKRNWRLLPATQDGVAIAQWHRLRVTFKLNQQ